MSASPKPTVRVLADPVEDSNAGTGAVSSVQRAELVVPSSRVDALWRPDQLERLARAYWRYLRRVSLGVLRVIYEPDARTVVALAKPFALLRFHAPEYVAGDTLASVTWRIKGGLLVAAKGRGKGHLRMTVERAEPAGVGSERLELTAEVRNFYPWLRGSGRFARVGTWVYSKTQLRIHTMITRGFLRSLARFQA